MDISTLLYDPLYAAFGVPATLTPGRWFTAGVAVTVIPGAVSTDVSDQFELGTVRPSAAVRRRDLLAAEIPLGDLDGGHLVFGDTSWRIEAHAAKPGPDGEASGELILFLSEDTNA